MKAAEVCSYKVMEVTMREPFPCVRMVPLRRTQPHSSTPQPQPLPLEVAMRHSSLSGTMSSVSLIYTPQRMPQAIFWLL